MSSQKIRNALGLLQDDEDNEAAWLELQDALTSPDVGLSDEELIDLLGAARREHETRREWSAVANLLEYEIAQCQGSSKEVARLAELARVLEDELLDDKRAVDVYKRWLDLRPDDPTATEAMARVEDQRAVWEELAERKLEEAKGVEDSSIRSSMLSWVAEAKFRFGREQLDLDELMALLEQAIELDPRNRRACMLLERVYRQVERWNDACRILEILATESPVREERFAAWLRLARVVVRKLGAEARGVAPTKERSTSSLGIRRP